MPASEMPNRHHATAVIEATAISRELDSRDRLADPLPALNTSTTAPLLSAAVMSEAAIAAML